VRLIGYVRVSRVAGRDGKSFISPDVQRERIKTWAKAARHTVVDVLEELDQPGSRYNRPGFQEALERIERGEADGLIVADFSRFARSVADAAKALQRLEDADAVLVSVRDGLDSSTPVGKFARTMMLAIAELELDRVRENWSSARRHAVERGIHVASRTPTGYVRGKDGRLDLDPVAAPIVAELFRLRADGASWTALARRMTDAGIVGPYGSSSWTPAAITKMLANRVYVGEARSGEYVLPDAHAAIVSTDEWLRAQSIGTPTASTNSGDVPLLGGLLRCASCRFTLKADTMKGRDGSRLRHYRCRGTHAAGQCPAPVSILARVIEPYVEEILLSAIKRGGPLARASADTKALKRATVAVREAEDELAAYRDETRISDLIGREAFLEGLEERALRVDDARAELVQAQERAELAGALPSTPGALASAWPGLTAAERRKLLGAVLDAVVVRGGRVEGRIVPVADRALVLWRGQAPADLPRRGHRVPLAPFPWPDDRPGDVGMAAA
jgi:site-specific DNA recombinase